MNKDFFSIELMNADHLAEVWQIAQENNLTAWNESDYKKELENLSSLLFVAKKNEQVVGFAHARLITSAVEIFNIAVAGANRRMRIGNELLRTVLQTAKLREASECWLEVRASNLAAIKFYQSNKFVINGKRRDYYSNPVEDALLMTLDFSDENSNF